MKRFATVFACALVSLVATGSSGATSGAATLGSPGVVQWRFQVSGQYVLHPPAVGPDGGVVVASSTGDVSSLTAAGALRWTVPSVGPSGGPSIGADGTVYVASMNTVTAIAASGSIRWAYTEPSWGQGVIAGPTVGPDGNIYVISDYGGLGAFALSPAGQLLWSNPGNPSFSEYGQLGAQIVFGSDRLYAAFDEFGVAPATMFGLSLGGDQQWATPLAGTDDMFMQQQRQPATGSDGSLYLTGMGGASGWSLYRVDPGSGGVLWNYSPWPSNGMSPPSVGPDGSVYFSRSLGYLESVTPAGRSRWTFSDGSIIDYPVVSPDGNVVVAGVRPNFGEPGSVRGWNAATGAVDWQVDLPNENGGYQVLYTQPRFSADSRTAYFGTAILAGGEEYSFLYAVGPGTGTPPTTPARIAFSVPGPLTAGVSATVTATALDSSGKRMLAYNAPATWSSLDGHLSPTKPSRFVNGISRNTPTISVPFHNDRLTISSGGTSRQSGYFHVLGPLKSISLNVAASITHGVPFTVKAVARDAVGNTLTTYNASATWSSLGGGLSPAAPVAFSKGISTTSATFSSAFSINRIVVTSGGKSMASALFRVF